MTGTGASDAAEPTGIPVANAAEARYRGLLAATSDLIFWTDSDGLLVDYHANTAADLAVPPEAFLGRYVGDVLPEPTASIWVEGVRKARQSGGVEPFEYSLPFPDEERRYEARALLCDSGEVVVLVRNITSRWRAQQELLRREQEFETLADNAPVIITRHDSAMRYTYVNRAFCTLMGGPGEHFVGKTGRELGFPESAQAPFEEAVKSAFEIGDLVSVGISSGGENGQPGDRRYYQVNVVPEFSEAGEPVSVLSIAHEITSLRKAQQAVEEINRRLEQRVHERTEELSALNQELAQALRLKDEFLASMSHELRTPLNAILGFTQAVRDQIYGPASERLLNSARAADTAGHHLLDLISDILDLSKIQAGRLKLSLDPVPVQSLCEASLQMVEKAAQKKGVLLASTVAPGVGLLLADGRRLKQMLVNLLSNAVKFTPEGGRIDLTVEGDREKKVIRFLVADTGIGIEKDQIPRLFQPFTQVDSQLSRPHSGTGLGLSLVLSMAALHGGGVYVESEPGRGSCFTILLPWTEAQSRKSTSGGETDRQAAVFHAAPRGSRGGEPGGAPLRLLLAEDNESNAILISDLLTANGYDVSLARTGFEAIQLARKLKPDVVLMDIQMPGMDGLEAIRRLRANEETKHFPILALTALAMPGDRERCLSAGANGYVTKPLDFAVLLETTQNLLGLPG